MFLWKPFPEITAGTTKKIPAMPQQNSMALHCCDATYEILENRKALASTLSIPLFNWVLADQTHSCNIHEVIASDLGKGAYSAQDAIANCDALYTKQKNILIGVFHADCVPILLYDKKQEIIAAIHSGWKGTAQNITGKTLQLLIEKEHCNPKDIYAYIGPSIGFEHLEVGAEVIDWIKQLPFQTSSFIQSKTNGKFQLNNALLNYYILQQSKIPTTQIMQSSIDTYANDAECFSYRKNKTCGRHFSFISQ